MLMTTGTIEMKDMRYMNLFEKITRVSTRYCFEYNEIIFFLVPKAMLRNSLGKDNVNIKRLNEILRRRIRIIPLPTGLSHVREFIQAIVNPVEFKDVEVKDDEIILTAGGMSKAALLGRNKRRFLEMQKIIKNFFGKEFRIA